VVVTGIGSQQVKNIASSVAVINMSNVQDKPITQLSQALQGGATGINVTQSSGLPGGDAAAIKIRGIASNLGSAPLVIVMVYLMVLINSIQIRSKVYLF